MPPIQTPYQERGGQRDQGKRPSFLTNIAQEAHLWDDIAPEVGVLRDGMWEAHGKDVTEPLDLVQRGLRVRHPMPVLDGWRMVPSNHMVNFLLEFC